MGTFWFWLTQTIAVAALVGGVVIPDFWMAVAGGIIGGLGLWELRT